MGGNHIFSLQLGIQNMLCPYQRLSSASLQLIEGVTSWGREQVCEHTSREEPVHSRPVATFVESCFSGV